jgi:hypothetical protein
MRSATRQRKHAMAGLRAIAGDERMVGALFRVIRSGKLAVDAVMAGEWDAWWPRVSC